MPIERRKMIGPKKIRKTPVSLVFQIVLIEIVFLLLQYLITKTKIAFNLDERLIDSTALIVFSSSFLQILNLVVILFYVLKWATSYFFITQDKVVIEKGILRKKINTYEMKSVQAIKVRQGMWGRILNYGDIELNLILIEDDAKITNIPKPRSYARYIEEHISKGSKREKATGSVRKK